MLENYLPVPFLHRPHWQSAPWWHTCFLASFCLLQSSGSPSPKNPQDLWKETCLGPIPAGALPNQGGQSQSRGEAEEGLCRHCASLGEVPGSFMPGGHPEMGLCSAGKRLRCPFPPAHEPLSWQLRVKCRANGQYGFSSRTWVGLGSASSLVKPAKEKGWWGKPDLLPPITHSLHFSAGLWWQAEPHLTAETGARKGLGLVPVAALMSSKLRLKHRAPKSNPCDPPQECRLVVWHRGSQSRESSLPSWPHTG